MYSIYVCSIRGGACVLNLYVCSIRAMSGLGVLHLCVLNLYLYLYLYPSMCAQPVLRVD